MGYNPAIPQSLDPILQSQGQIQPNYAIIAQAFQANHYTLTSNSINKGMHKVILMKKQAIDPATSASQVALYNKLVTLIPELFFAPSGSQTPIQLTYSSLNTNPASISQYSFVAGPFVVYGGLVSVATIGQVVTLSPSTNLLYVGLIAANIRKVSSLTNYTPVPTSINTPMSSFTIQYQTLVAPGTKVDIYYLAIGKP